MLIMSFLRKIIRQFENLIGHFSLVGDTTFFHEKQFSWVEDLESNWQKIKIELDGILQYKDELPNIQDILANQYKITQDNLWKTYILYGYGYKAEKNCERCPETTKLIEKIPGMKTALFSILLPHKHLPEHRGPYKGLIRYQLGLIIPQPNNKCRIRVGEDIKYWEEGKSLLFDDTFPHEVWNDTNSIRVVLFMDIVRPLPFPFSIINKMLINLIAWSPFIQEGRKNNQVWDERLEKILPM